MIGGAEARLSVAQRAAVEPFHVMDVWAAAGARQRSHGDLINLSAGQPSTPAPAPVRTAAVQALNTDVLGYTVATGIPELRSAIAGHYLGWYGVTVEAEDVLVTTGASGGFLLAFLAAFDAGDRVALARPGYPCYRNILGALDCEVVELDCGPDTRFQPTRDMLEEVHRSDPVKGLILASPANPTGTVLEPDELADIARWCEDNGVQLVSDEIYHGLSYPGAPSTSCAWQTSREAIVVNSFSKYFSMTGWRLGWLVLPPRLADAAYRLAGNFTVCPPALPQHAAVAAFDPVSIAEVEGHVARYAVNRSLLLNGLPEIGIEALAPADGAFYVYADIGHLSQDTMSYCRTLLADTGIAVAPGLDFDTVRGQRFIRLSFAGETADISEALDRLGKYWG
ncbi:pyridoxal phosphate-dependent aminotransferase [Pseudonocardia spinosispora]|uniref:pyridoxal phosphate-dependent aminotransferase n=1 Tax=Pseudonocardia spinosispora TaxID=103441 RepID=UPI0006873147|nr:pyridoxal phosphate-dependent aminotransferase [Pseudonocardia spinosispora]